MFSLKFRNHKNNEIRFFVGSFCWERLAANLEVLQAVKKEENLRTPSIILS